MGAADVLRSLVQEIVLTPDRENGQRCLGPTFLLNA